MDGNGAFERTWFRKGQLHPTLVVHTTRADSTD